MAAVWERQPDETLKAFHAFTLYRDMPPQERSLSKVADKLGVAVNSVGVWSSPKKYNWLERVMEFDKYNDSIALTVAQGTSIEAKQAIMQQEGIENAALTQIVMESLRIANDSKLLKTDMLSLGRLVSLIERIQVMRRRNVGLPANYTTKFVEEEENASPIYYAQPEVIERGSSEEEDD